MAMELVVTSQAVTTTGSASSATGSGTIVLPSGYIEWIYYAFHASAAATTDTTIAFANTPPGGNLIVLTNVNTSGLYYPRATAHTAAGAAITNSFTRIATNGPLTISVAQGDALAPCVTVYIAVAVED